MEVGAGEDAARAAVRTEAGAAGVAADLDLARRAGITSVPSFVIDWRHLIPGAQDVDTMVALLSRAGGMAA